MRAGGAPFFPSFAIGVGHEPESLSDMRSADARSAAIDRPAGVVLTFQVRRNKVEPAKSVVARNLFTKDDSRTADADKVVPVRPYVPLIIKPCSFACRGERLARAGARPHRTIVEPACVPERIAPDTDTGKEVTLREAAEVRWCDIPKIPFVYDAWGDRSCRDQFSKPCRSMAVHLVVVGGAS